MYASRVVTIQTLVGLNEQDRSHYSGLPLVMQMTDRVAPKCYLETKARGSLVIFRMPDTPAIYPECCSEIFLHPKSRG